MLQCDYQADVFICDEADELIDKCAVVFSQQKKQNSYDMYGLACAFFASRVYFMSAQFDPYHIQLIKDAFCFKEETLTFKNFATMLSGIPTDDFQKDGAVSLDLDELREMLCKKVTSTFD